MSKQALESAIGKAILDIEFRNLLFANPEEALSAFELTHMERIRIKHVDSETLELLARILNARLTQIGSISNAYFMSVSRPGANISKPGKGNNK